ncbi:uncharacterized protein LTR77_004008 [Saxophila tyrrhenica]|uniref:Protein phosphatase n=1 Tax=Saxophila tyrrhenica TaxID=1690608 RepID=A0AAV9PFY9_9PEZI|nr:hypothetical protein LTR77_004008 [Saxophila tyrrhenica]
MLALRLTPRTLPLRRLPILLQTRTRHDDNRSRDPQIGLTTPVPSDAPDVRSTSPFYFEAGWAGWAKRPTRPFPPPFFSPPSGSFSDPLSTHNRAQDRRPKVNGQMIRGVTNGDDALLASPSLVGVNDGVGAWGQKERGCAPLWSRLIMHFWAIAAEGDEYGGGKSEPDPVKYLDEAYNHTKEALSEPNEWLGTTTACSALLHYTEDGDAKPIALITQLGDSKCLVVRATAPDAEHRSEIIFGTEEQWHYFDCPRQLGTNSPDEPLVNAVLSKIEIQEDDIVLAMSDGVTDNLWEEEIADTAVDTLKAWRDGDKGKLDEGMRHVAQEIVLAARKIAEDPFAASPFMERGVDEGLAIEGEMGTIKGESSERIGDWKHTTHSDQDETLDTGPQ